MALRDDMARSGRYLFRWRSYLPLLFAPILVVGLVDGARIGGSDSLDNLLWEALCGAIAAAGLALRAFTVGYVPAHTSGRNTDRQVAQALNVKGMYSIVRHPLYLGNFLIWLGVSSFAQKWWLVLVTTLAFCVYYERIMLAEEEFLSERFANEFEQWATRTPAFIPTFKHWMPSDLPFSWKTVLARENATVLATIMVFFLLEVIADFFAGRMPHVDFGWAVLVATAVVIYGVIRWMKTHKRLAVEGR
jgi:protein-S-isoprenylcysteine O-methyltransferase Ste14